ncbi:hypothetical protein D3C73_767680 [compost metagenome]
MIKTAEKLLPAFYECNFVAANAKIIDLYTLDLNASGASSEPSQVTINILPNETYTLSSASGRMYYNIGTVSGPIRGIVDSDGGSVSFTTPSDAQTISVQCLNLVSYGDINNPSTFVYGAGKFIFKNPILTLGTEPKPFKPQRNSMLAFQTELYANPTDGSEPDVLSEQNGEFKKLAKWEKVVLDGALGWVLNNGAVSGVKRVGAPITSNWLPFISGKGFATKYNGSSLTLSTAIQASAAADSFTLWNNGYVYIDIANTDSGWGNNYDPTQDEIKAYFWGWKMYDVNVDPTGGGVYNRNDGVGKWWCPIDKSSSGVSTLPTTKIASVSSYNLLYRLAKENVQPVVAEGCLTLTEGVNLVEVDTGVVLRELAHPMADSYGNYQFNLRLTGWESTRLKHKAEKMLSIMKNDGYDHFWLVENDPVGAFGNVKAVIRDYNYDQLAVYSATYIKTDKSPIQPIAGMLATTEKAQIIDLTAGVVGALRSVSVLQMKKAEKDAPEWITPTLLNGSVHGSAPVRYKKMPDGTIIIVGIFVPVTSGAVFKLSVGYRPSSILRMPVMSFDNEGAAVHTFAYIYPTGEVNIGPFGNNYSCFDGISFLAEQ